MPVQLTKSGAKYRMIFGHFCKFVALVPSLVILPLFSLDLLIPITVDSKPSWNTLSLVPSSPLANNLILMAIFIVQHSILKTAVKDLILKVLPPETEKSFYTLNSALCLYLLWACWLPMTDYKLWDIQNLWLYYGIIGLALLSFYAFLKTTFQATKKIKDINLYGDESTHVNPIDSKGRRRSSVCFVALQRPSRVCKDGIYSYIRHPMMAFLLYTICLSPTMSVGHALWSGVMSLYIVSAVVMFEEPALIEEFGEEYKQYMKEVPGFVPNMNRVLGIQ